MRIGILTFQFADNYGAVLQAYALKRHLEEHYEAKVKIINYVNYKLENAYTINPFKKLNYGLRAYVRSVLNLPKRYRQFCMFEEFRYVQMGLEKKIVKQLNMNDYDCVVVGSDQVWNLGITFGDMNYFLPKVGYDQCKRVSYAASANDDFTSSQNISKIVQCLKQFSSISVREIPLMNALNNALDLKCTLVLDPVFLQSKDFWRSFASMPKNMPPKYILYYALLENTDLEKEAIILSNRESIPIIVIHPTCKKISHCGKLKTDVGPKEFVGIIQNATYIVSNSFHAFAFAVLFSKEIYFENLKGASNRVESLVSIMGLKPILHKNNIQSVKIDDSYNDKLKKYINISKKFIEHEIVKEENN